MVESAKIKIYTIAGTVAIISTSYILHASTFYTQLYENCTDIQENYSKKVESNSGILNVTELKPSKIVEKDQLIKSELTPAIKLDNINQTNKEIVKKLKTTQENIIVKNEQITQKIQKPEAIEIVEVKEPIKEEVVSKNELNKDKLSSFKEYLYLQQSSGALTKRTKEYLDQIIPIVNELSDYYIEVEGYSAKSALANELSLKYAQEVAKYLKYKNINKKIIITSYADNYPIIDDQNDIRNSRVELKFRRGLK
jgi:outer membrane protein OmpA-like peptidoglycan-associated protein